MAREMTTDQLTAAQRRVARVDDTGSSVGWGPGVAVRDVPDERGWPPAGAFGWDGGLGSRWLVDPARKVVAVCLLTDSFFALDVLATLDDFRNTVGATLT